MNKNILLMGKILPLALLALVLSAVIVVVGTASPIPVINQTNPATTVYLDEPMINGTVIGKEFTVNINIRDAQNIYSWQVGLTFNATLLECTGFFEGEFLKDVAPPGNVFYTPGTINNTAGLVRPPSVCTLLGDYSASDKGRLVYATFKVKATGVSDIHLSDVKVIDYPDLKFVPVNIIDVYTVVDTTPNTVVMVSNLTGATAEYVSGFYGHAFNKNLKEISFNVTGPDTITDRSGIHEISGSFSNVTVPKALLEPEPLYGWGVIIDGTSVRRTVIDDDYYTYLYFTYAPGVHEVQITTRFLSSNISISLSPTSITVGSNVTISGEITPSRPGFNVTIYYRLSGETWTTLETVLTDENSHYRYTWKPAKAGTYEVKASWEGDEITLDAESEVKILKVKGAGGIPLEIVAAAVVAIIIIAAIVVYFIRFRKSKP